MVAWSPRRRGLRSHDLTWPAKRSESAGTRPARLRPRSARGGALPGRVARRLAVALGRHRASVSCSLHAHCPKEQDEQQHEVEEQNEQSTCGKKLPAHGREKQVDATDDKCVGRNNAREEYRGQWPCAIRNRLGRPSFGSCSLRRSMRCGCVLTHAPPSFPSPCPRRDAHILLGCDGLRKSLTVFLQRDPTNLAVTLPLPVGGNRMGGRCIARCAAEGSPDEG